MLDSHYQDLSKMHTPGKHHLLSKSFNQALAEAIRRDFSSTYRVFVTQGKKESQLAVELAKECDATLSYSGACLQDERYLEFQTVRQVGEHQEVEIVLVPTTYLKH